MMNRLETMEMTSSGKLMMRYLESQGFGSHHLDSFNQWFDEFLKININRSIRLINGNTVHFENVRTNPPRYVRNGKSYTLYPKMALDEGLTYGREIYVDVVEYLPNGQVATMYRGNELVNKIEPNVCIGLVPIVLHSKACNLYGKSAKELARLGEDPFDPKGVFIVAGEEGSVEKVILLQEQLAVNRIFIFMMKVKNKLMPVSRMTTNTISGTALIELVLDKSSMSIIKIMLPSTFTSKDTKSRAKGSYKQTNKNSKVNVLRIYRLLGVEDPEMIKNYIKQFIPVEHQRACMLKLTPAIVNMIEKPDDYGIIAKKAGIDVNDTSPEAYQRRMAKVADIIRTDIFPHMDDLPYKDGQSVEERDSEIRLAKINMLSIVIARYIEYLSGYRPLDDRDSWANKRVRSAGSMMESLFRNAWRKTLTKIQGDILKGKMPPDIRMIAGEIKNSFISESFRSSFIGSKWGVKGMQNKDNVTQTLSRDGIVSTYAHINTINVGVSRTDGKHEIRLVRGSQYGFVCHVSTPDGDNCGIIKNLSILAKVSIDHDDIPVINRISSYINSSSSETHQHKVMINSKFLGWADGVALRNLLITWRRANVIANETSVILSNGWLYIDMSPARLIRPVLIVDEQTQQLLLDQRGLRDAPIPTMFAEGVMEYLSAWEQEQDYITIARSPEVLNQRMEQVKSYDDKIIGLKYKISLEGESAELERELRDLQQEYQRFLFENPPYTHCNIDEKCLLSVPAALIPWANHNQSPRNSFQVSMGKQALGIFHTNYQNRMDSTAKFLMTPQRPLIDTDMAQSLGLNYRGQGQNVFLAFLAYPYTEEDNVVFKQSTLDYGGFRMYKTFTYKTSVELSTESLARPKERPDEKVGRYRYIQTNGLPMIGAYLTPGDCIIGKIRTTPEKGVDNASILVKIGDQGVVDKVAVTTDNKKVYVTVKIRLMRVPVKGDKFAPRNAQKATIGQIVQDAHLPYTKLGLSPDEIGNPTSMPSRMTISYVYEGQSGVYAGLTGQIVNGSPHIPPEDTKKRAELQRRGFDGSCYEMMRSNITGQKMKRPIYMGLMFVQALRHHVHDKIQSRGWGLIKPVNHQPAKGRANGGGLRYGEMERDALISHGASRLITVMLKKMSDGYDCVFCLNCGSIVAPNMTAPPDRVLECNMCKNSHPDKFVRMNIPYAYKLLMQLLSGAGIFLRPRIKSLSHYAKELTQGKKAVSVDADIDEESPEDEAIDDEDEEIDDFDADMFEFAADDEM